MRSINPFIDFIGQLLRSMVVIFMFVSFCKALLLLWSIPWVY